MKAFLIKYGHLSIIFCTLPLCLTGLLNCRKDDPKPRDIRVHTALKLGIAHAEPSLAAERMCQDCHGVNLVGGKNFEPSCYGCHGKNWGERDAETSIAPSTHTERYGKYMHHPELRNPTGSCDDAGCHGAGLTGIVSFGTPSCELCHGRLWEQGGT